MNNLKILVTGASRGIGHAVAKGLIECGHKVFITSRNEDKLREIQAELGAEGYMACDLRKKEDLIKLGKYAEENCFDVLINNAGEYTYNKIENISEEEITSALSVNLKAAIYLSSKSAENMKKNNWGRIINIGSISGVMGEAGASVYSASKAGLIGFSKALGLELAPFGITVNVINPGWVETELGLKSVEESDFSYEETVETIPQKRFVKPQEVEKMIEYLISDDAKGVTGQSINLCAGLSVGF